MMELAAARLRVDDPWLLVVSGRGGWYRVGVAASRFPAPLWLHLQARPPIELGERLTTLSAEGILHVSECDAATHLIYQ